METFGYHTMALAIHDIRMRVGGMARSHQIVVVAVIVVIIVIVERKVPHESLVHATHPQQTLVEGRDRATRPRRRRPQHGDRGHKEESNGRHAKRFDKLSTPANLQVQRWQ